MGSPEPLRPPTIDPAIRPAPFVPGAAQVGCVLAWLGVCLCFLLVQRESAFSSWLCPPRGGCETVLGSQYGAFRGIPLPWLGAAFYSVLLGLWLAVCAVASTRARLWLLDAILWLLVASLTLSLGLMYIQFGVLHAFCPLCTASALTVAALTVTVFPARRAVATGSAGGSPASALTLAVFALLPILIFAASTFAKQNTSGGLLLVDLAAAHRRGPVNAPVQIVVYSDFQCSFCRQLAPVLRQVEKEFPREVAVVYRHFPLPIHPRAMPAAIAAECAAEQGRFWEYHDQLFAEGGDLDDAKLLAVASSLGLDRARFEACQHSDQPRREVESNLREATELGLPGSPSVFLNGRRVEDAPTHENLVRRIKEALRAPQQTGSVQN